MSMSKKDYEMTAAILRPEVERVLAIIKISDNERNSDYAKAISRIVHSCVSAFRQSNPSFRPSAFFVACGMTDSGEWDTLSLHAAPAEPEAAAPANPKGLALRRKARRGDTDGEIKQTVTDDELRMRALSAEPIKGTEWLDDLFRQAEDGER